MTHEFEGVKLFVEIYYRTAVRFPQDDSVRPFVEVHV